MNTDEILRETAYERFLEREPKCQYGKNRGVDCAEETCASWWQGRCGAIDGEVPNDKR